MDKAVNEKAMPGFAPPPLSEREKNVIIGGVLLSMLLAALDQTIVAPAMPTIAGALGHAEYLPWIVTGYLLTATAMAPLYGKISDIYGRRPTIYAAVLIFLAGSLISAMAPNMLVLVIGRAVQGLGGGGLFTLTQTVIGDLVPPFERARYAAWISGTWAVASIAGPLLGGTFAEHLHWSLIFWINIPLGLLAMAIINNPLKKLPVVARDHRVDGWGALLLVIATSLLLLALNWGGSEYSWASPEILGLLACSALFWAAFALRLMRAVEPLISLEVLGNPIVLAGTLSMFLLHGRQCGHGRLPAGLSAVGARPVGQRLGHRHARIAARHRRRRDVQRTHDPAFLPLQAHRDGRRGLQHRVPRRAGAGRRAAPLALVEFLTICIGIGAGTAFPVFTVSVQNAVDKAHLGVATGVLTFLRSLGGALGVAMLGAIALGYGLPLGGEAMQIGGHAASATPFAMIFLACGATMLAALLTLALMPEKPLRRREVAPTIVE